MLRFGHVNNEITIHYFATRLHFRAMSSTPYILALRTRLGLTQAALAEKIGSTKEAIGSYERRGITIPPAVAARLIRYARRRGVTITFNDVYSYLLPVVIATPHTSKSREKPAGDT